MYSQSGYEWLLSQYLDVDRSIDSIREWKKPNQRGEYENDEQSGLKTRRHPRGIRWQRSSEETPKTGSIVRRAALYGIRCIFEMVNNQKWTNRRERVLLTWRTRNSSETATSVRSDTETMTTSEWYIDEMSEAKNGTESMIRHW